MHPDALMVHSVERPAVTYRPTTTSNVDPRL
jgi:hypothetical protein